MIKILSLLLLTGCLLSGCSTPAHQGRGPSETVMITYRVKAGKEAELKNVLDRAWKIYRSERLVFAEPHVIVQDKEKRGGIRVVEIFTWVSPDAPDHAQDSVKAIWNEMQALVEARDGHGGLEGGEVTLVTGAAK